MLGLKNVKKTEKKLSFSDEEKRIIIEDFLHNGGTKQSIWEKYGGYGEEHGRILRWMRQIGYIADSKRKDSIFVLQNVPMDNLKKAKETYSYFEYAKLQKRVEELEKQLCESELQAIAYQTMVELAERELKISIKKKFNTKPSKK